MSPELEISQLTDVELDKIKRGREKSIGRESKKRKRKTDEQLNDTLPTPTKKRRPPDRSDPTPVTDIPDVQSETLDESPFYEKSYSLYLPISPISYHYPLSGLCAEHLSPLILKYYPPFHGVILSYSNVHFTPHSRQSQELPDDDAPGPILAKSVDEYAASYVWITADFLVFSPKRGNSIEGWINIQNQGSLGLLCWNFFNVHIERKRLPKDWSWVSRISRSTLGASQEINEAAHGGETQIREEGYQQAVSVGEGCFQDRHGKRVEGLVRFRVRDVESSRSLDRENSFLSILGTMLIAKEEQALEKRERTLSIGYENSMGDSI